MRLESRGNRGERGQALLLFVGFVTVILVIAAIVIDFGLWLGERRSVQNVADLAALAGSQDLPGDDVAAVASAVDWADKNGFQSGVEGVEVTVTPLCKNTLSAPPTGVCTNTSPPGSGPSECALGSGCDSLRVTIRKPVQHLFTAIFGIDDLQVMAGASAVAGLEFDMATLDTAILLDASGAMLTGCDATRANDGCEIKEARDAAHGLVDMLVGGAGNGVRVGYVPFNYCYKPPGSGYCTRETTVVSLTSGASELHTAIDATEAWSWTNVCVPLARAEAMFASAGAAGSAGRSVVLLTGGDNNSYYDQNGIYIPLQCRPAPATTVDFRRGCSPAWDQEREVDSKTLDMADELKAEGVEIYVVGLDVCGAEDGQTASDPGYCDGIGDNAHDNVADQRLLKCIASSQEHYFRVASAQELPEIFQQVAVRIVGRGLLQ